jgi:hypothetical protein
MLSKGCDKYWACLACFDCSGCLRASRGWCELTIDEFDRAVLSERKQGQQHLAGLDRTDRQKERNLSADAVFLLGSRAGFADALTDPLFE